MRRRLFLLFTLLAAASLAQAHFVFVVPAPDGTTAKVFLSETLNPEGAVGAEMLAGLKLSALTPEGEKPLSLTGSSGFYTVELPKDAQLIHGSVDLGVQQMGSAKQPYVLIYHPRTLLGNAFDSSLAAGGDSPVEIVPAGKPGALKLRLQVHGKPQADSEITVILPDATQKKVKTYAAGETELLTQVGRYGAWARFWEATPGERDSKKYAEVRHYATVVFDANSETSSRSEKNQAVQPNYFATLPQATSSFGAAVSDGWLYVYGGHIAPTHSYSTASVSGQFARINLSNPEKWEQLPSGPALQGMNLAVHQGKIYRIGGMAPRNKPGDPEANFSSADCARFDPASGKWEPLPPLPDPRSSHDVVVMGDKLIVTGGWTLKGSERTEWRDTLTVLDLTAAKPEWQSVPQPLKRRALIAAALSGRMYVLGGFDDHGKILHDVSI